MIQRRSNFVIFLVISFGISIPLFSFSTMQTSPALITLLLLAGSYAPALGGWIAASRDGEEAKRAFRQRLGGWAGRTWIALALIIPSILWLIVYGVSVLQHNAGKPAWAVLAALPVIFLVNYGEEIGWRGFALPYLMKQYNPFTASLVLGVIWALFHSALYWQRPAFGLLTSVIIVLMSFLLAWLFVNTQRILPGTLFHAVFNTWTNVFVTAEDERLLMVAILLESLLAGYLLIRYGKELVVAS
jgi:membrane protease YdiL (CAAX protease family)